MKFKFKYLVLFALLLVSPMAFAASSSNVTSDMLARSFAEIQCKTTFSTSFASDIAQVSPQANTLTPLVSQLQADVASLQTDVNNNDNTSYKAELSTYDSDLGSLDNAVKAWRPFAKNLTKSDKLTLVSDELSLRSTLETCRFTQLQEYANDEVSEHTNDINVYQSQVGNLSAKGLDTSALSSLLSSAQTSIVTPLQNAVSSATNASQLSSDLQQYCLYNGCTGTNFHLAAKWDIAKETAIESYLQASNKSANFTSQFSEVTSDLSQSQSALNTVGTAAYAPGQSASVFDPLNDAYKVLLTILRGMRNK